MIILVIINVTKLIRNANNYDNYSNINYYTINHLLLVNKRDNRRRQ